MSFIGTLTASIVTKLFPSVFKFIPWFGAEEFPKLDLLFFEFAAPTSAFSIR